MIYDSLPVLINRHDSLMAVLIENNEYDSPLWRNVAEDIANFSLLRDRLPEVLLSIDYIEKRKLNNFVLNYDDGFGMRQLAVKYGRYLIKNPTLTGWIPVYF